MPMFDSVRLSVAEAVNNCIEHAYRYEAGHDIDISFELLDDNVTIRISDSGSPVPDGLFDDVHLPEYDPDDSETFPEGGFGLFIIKSQMDKVLYESHNGINTLTLIKLLGEAQAA